MTANTTEVWEAFSQQIREFIHHRVSDPNDADDILQEVFIKLHTRIDTLKDDERLLPWLYQIARNTIIDHYRSQHLLEELPEALSVDSESMENEPAAHIAAGLKQMVNSLPEKYRQALLLTEFRGLKQSEMAKELGLSLSGAKSRVQRGRQMLRDTLLDCCHFEFDRRGHMIDYTPRPDCCSRCCA